MNLINRLQLNQNNLSANEKRIISEVLEQQPSIDNIKSFAREFSASPSAISKLSKKLGYKNFQEFILSISDEKEVDSKVHSSNITIHDYYNRLIDNTNQMIEPKIINTLISKIIDSEFIVIIGIGNSGFSAIEFASRLERMGLKVKGMTDPHQMKMQASILSEKDLIIGISNSGETSEVVDSIMLARQHNVPNFVITHHYESNLGKVAENIMIVSSNTQVNDERFINSQISNLYLIDVISYELLEQPKLSEFRKKTLEVLNRH
jgi:DNA-binding MurR/RpiR family transcriptional regulator